MAPARKKQAVGSSSKPSASPPPPPPPPAPASAASSSNTTTNTNSGSTTGAKPLWAPVVPPGQEELDSWPGWAERESDPALFNSLIKGLGVQDVTLQEVYSLNAEALIELSQPIHGIIFLSRWCARNQDAQEDTCPPGLWFANQTVTNACSTIALLNILLNASDIELGTDLAEFKSTTMPMDPYHRGDAINNSTHIRKHHNSMARRLQMLVDDADEAANYDSRAEKAKPTKPKPKPTKPKATNKKRKRAHSDSEDADSFGADAANHYLSFIPHAGAIWMLDGLERQPTKIAPLPASGPWTDALKPWLDAEMARMDGDTALNIMTVTRDPLRARRDALAANIRMLTAHEAALAAADPAWVRRIARSPSEEADDREALRGADAAHGVTAAMVAEASTAAPGAATADDDLDGMMAAHKALVDVQSRLRCSVLQAAEAARAELAGVEAGRFDFTPLIAAWLARLADKEGVLQELLDL